MRLPSHFITMWPIQHCRDVPCGPLVEKLANIRFSDSWYCFQAKCHLTNSARSVRYTIIHSLNVTNTDNKPVLCQDRVTWTWHLSLVAVCNHCDDLGWTTDASAEHRDTWWMLPETHNMLKCCSFSHTYLASTLCWIPVGLHALHWCRLAWLGGGRHVYRTLLTLTPRTVQHVLYRPTCAIWSSRNSARRGCGNIGWTNRTVHQIPVMAVDTRWRQAAYAWSCCIKPVTIGPTTVCAGTTNQIWIRIRILQTKFEF